MWMVTLLPITMMAMGFFSEDEGTSSPKFIFFTDSAVESTMALS
jgi:hypothetical protein